MFEGKEFVCINKWGHLEIWRYNAGFEFLGLIRYEMDNVKGEFWVTGDPDEHGRIILGLL